MRAVHGIDISNWQGRMTSEEFEQLQQRGIQHVMVRLSTESSHLTTIAHAQLATAGDTGMELAGYGWAYWNTNARDEAQQWLEVASTRHDVQFIAIDAEAHGAPQDGGAPRSRLQAMDWCLDAADVIQSNGYRPIIYTAEWWWRTWGVEGALSGLPLLYARYDGTPQITWDTDKFGGWSREQVWGKQWTSEPLDHDYWEFPDPEPPLDSSDLERKVAELESIRGYLTRDLPVNLEWALRYKTIPRGTREEIQAVINEMRRLAA